ncbi:fibronectin type III domain-containing protein [Dactylosporangium sp. NPDC049742]|uniref:fibronectin type III domain-containing protein n=1 Tax=Dactylosporangium sp. NPDC049742 TaxID=3154737 RepID=UPI00342AE2EE
MRARLTVLLLVAALLYVLPDRTPAFAAPPAGGMTGTQLTTAFNTYGDTSGRWSGADSTTSVLLPDGRIVWLFSDTLLGTVNADHSRPRSSPFINNSMVVQDGSALTTTLTGGTASAPQALLPQTADGQFYWVGDGEVEGSNLRVVYNRYRRTGTGSLDVALSGTVLATFALPSLALTGVTDLTPAVGSTVTWGAQLVTDGGFTYIYGSDYVPADAMRFARLARVPAGGLSGPWEFWNGTSWSASAASSARLPLSGVGTAYGVQKLGGQWVLVTVESNVVFNAQVVAYTASNPWGPFSGPVDLLTAPEPANQSGVIVYDAHVHPELAPSGKLLVSYNVNSLNDGDLYDDARIYRPRFADIAWPRPVPDPATVPAAPASLTATASSAGTVELSWPGSSPSYVVYQRDVTAGQTHFARVGQPTTASATLGGFKTAHTYEFKVAARNANGEGPASPVRSVLMTIAPPVAPAGLTAVPQSDGSVNLAWSAVPNAWRYDVSRRDLTAGETEYVEVSDPTPADTTATIAWLTNDHQYEFVVTASHGGGKSPYSTSAKATVHYTVPSAPANLTAVAQGDGTIKLDWTSTASNVYFWVYQRDVTNGEADFTKLPLPTTALTLTAGYLAHNHRYEFKIVANNLGGDSPPSNLAQATAVYPAPAAPANLRAVAGNGQVQLTWDTSPTPDVWYWVYQRDVTAGEATFQQLPIPISTCCTMTAGYLVNGHQYEFKVTSVAAGGESGPTNLVRATPNLPLPPQVTGVTATTRSDGQIGLSWASAGPDLYYWIAMRDVTAGGAMTRLSLPTTGLSFTAGYLTHNHVYEFTVTAANSAGEGPVSATARATARFSPPPAPTGLKAVAAGDGTIDLDWDAPAPSLYYWVYYRDVTAGAAFAKSGLPTDKTSASWGPLVNGHVYEFKVTGENQGGEGPASATARATSTGGLPKAPSGLSATAGDGQVTLRWTASGTANVYYWVEYRPAGGTWQRLQYPVTTCCAYTVGLLANGTTYEFRVRANNVSGDSPASNVASARPLPPLPAAPTGLTAAVGDGRITLRWTASSTPNVYYWVEYRPAGGVWQRLEYPLSTCCTFTVTYLTNGTYYEFRLRATNLAGDSAPSVAAGARPMPPLPTAPGSLSAAAQGDTAVRLTWTASSPSNVYYWIYYRYAGTSAWTRAAYPVTTCCTFTMSLLTPGRTYEFMLRAENLAGLSGNSTVSSATLTIITPGTPGGVRAYPTSTSTSVSTVTVAWSAAADATGYSIEARACRGGGWQTIKMMITGTTSTVSYTTGCYEYRVVADRFGRYGGRSGSVIAFGPVDDYPWADYWFPYLDPYEFVKKQCTSFVASRVDKYYSRKPPNFNGINYYNAKNWDEATAKYGGAISHTAAPGAIAQWNGGQYGHVAWVSGVDGGMVFLEEYNFNNPEAYGRRWVSASSVDNFLLVN